MPQTTSEALNWVLFGTNTCLHSRSSEVIITALPIASSEKSFQDDEVAKEVRFVEEIVMDGNPKAPRFHVEPHIEPPREAYAQHVRLIAWNVIVHLI